MSSFLLFEQFSIEIREYWQGTIEAGVEIVLLWFLQAIFLLLSIVLPLLLLRPFFIEDFQVFFDDVTAAMLISPNKEMVAILIPQIDPSRIER